MTDRDDYSVGYKRPPLHGQFKRGQSGNPKGRPKGQKNLHQEVLDELLSPVTIKENGRPVTVTKVRAIVKAQTAKAAGGDTRAATFLIEIALKADGAASQTDEAALIPDDEVILAAYRDKLKREGRHE